MDKPASSEFRLGDEVEMISPVGDSFRGHINVLYPATMFNGPAAVVAWTHVGDQRLKVRVVTAVYLNQVKRIQPLS